MSFVLRTLYSFPSFHLSISQYYYSLDFDNRNQNRNGGVQHCLLKKLSRTAKRLTSKYVGIFYSAFETINIMLGSSMKFLQTVRASAKVKDTSCILDPNSMGYWFFSQAYRADFQRFGLSKVALWFVNKEVTAAQTAKEILDIPVPKRDRLLRRNSEPN